MGEPKEADARTARLLLLCGGVFGLHRFYLNQIPEAFMFLSTGGFCLIGVFYDSFYIHGMVEEYNRSLQLNHDDVSHRKYKNGKLLKAVSKVVPFSLSHILLSQLYSMWLGLLCWLAVSLTFGVNFRDGILSTIFVAAAVCSGVYVVGNRKNQSRDLVYIWLSGFSTAFLAKEVLGGSCIRIVVSAALVATCCGNRVATFVANSPSTPRFNSRHFQFWSSLFLLLICILAVGLDRHVLKRRVILTESHGNRAIRSMGSLLHDRYYNKQSINSHFRDMHKIQFKVVEEEDTSKGPLWTDYLNIFIIDVLRAETDYDVINATKTDPLRWAAFRQYLLVYCSEPPDATDKQLKGCCSSVNKPTKSSNDYSHKLATISCSNLSFK